MNGHIKGYVNGVLDGEFSGVIDGEMGAVIRAKDVVENLGTDTREAEVPQLEALEETGAPSAAETAGVLPEALEPGENMPEDMGERGNAGRGGENHNGEAGGAGE